MKRSPTRHVTRRRMPVGALVKIGILGIWIVAAAFGYLPVALWDAWKSKRFAH